MLKINERPQYIGLNLLFDLPALLLHVCIFIVKKSGCKSRTFLYFVARKSIMHMLFMSIK